MTQHVDWWTRKRRRTQALRPESAEREGGSWEREEGREREEREERERERGELVL
jgi:hypothetical protein